jgi:hypothetical protein
MAQLIMHRSVYVRIRILYILVALVLVMASRGTPAMWSSAGAFAGAEAAAG